VYELSNFSMISQRR